MPDLPAEVVKEVAMLRRLEAQTGWVMAAIALLGGAIPNLARAHVTLLEPESWIEQNALGDPQKTGPCGGEGTETGAITTYQAGETITVRWTETIPHPGHFRIALARDRSELADPEIEVDGFCNYDPDQVTFDTEYPVLANNLFPRAIATEGGPMFSHEVTIPEDFTCERCTLQLIQFMTEHLPSCLYYKCADVRIVAADTPAEGDAGVAGASGEAGSDATAGQGGGGAAGMRAAPPSTGGVGGAGGASAPMEAGAGATPAAEEPSLGEAGGGTPPSPGDYGEASGAASDSGESSGCGVARGTRGGAGAVGLALFALLAMRRRR